ncbi:MAG TPA: serine hydrolase [Planctomycetota bacterium]|nr:serine hydrolase [Planctomycetota bacterium]
MAARSQVVAYHDQNGAAHQLQHDTLTPLGYRMIALTIYGSTSAPSYAAVWVHRAGPPVQAFHGLTAAQYQSFSDTWWPLGYRPKILSAMGTAANPRFAGTYELTNAAGWTSHGLTQTEFWDERDSAKQSGFDVTAVDVYGSNTDPRFVVAFGPVDAGQATIVSVGDSDYQEHFDALGSGHNRPALVACNDAHRYVSLWRSDDVGDWVGHHDMTATEYQNHFDTYLLQNRYPIALAASGSGSSRRFTAIWAPSDLPLLPTFTAIGPTVPQFAPFDTWVHNWMLANSTRAASLAIARNGRLVHARGYTLAGAGYPLTQPTSLFEIASNTKPLTSILVHQHFANPTSGVAPLNTMLSYFPTIALDPRAGQITLHHLLTHQGGWDRNVSPDPMVGLDPTIAATFFQPLPIGKNLIYRYMIGTQLLDFDPGTDSQYSNFGYSVLGQVLEAANPGLSYEQLMKTRVFAPLGITRPLIADSLVVHPGEVRYHPYVPMLSRSVVDDSRPWVAGQYGGLNKENMDSHGAWVMAAPDYAKVLAAFDLGASNPVLDPTQTAAMWTVEPGYPTLMRGWYLRNVADGLGGQVRMCHHNGRLYGAVSFIARRMDGLSFVFLTNGDRTNLDGGVHGEQLSNIANTISLWPTWDLFPQVGLPSFTHVSGSVTPFGVPCPGSAGQPTLTVGGTPEIGSVLSMQVGHAPANRFAVVALGLSTVVAPLAAFGAPGCYLYTDPVTTFAAITGSTGTATIGWTLPTNPAAIGVVVTAQGAVLDPPANALGITTTRAQHVQLGGWQ